RSLYSSSRRSVCRLLFGHHHRRVRGAFRLLPFRQGSILLSCALRRTRLALSLRPLTVCLSASALLSLVPSLMLRRRVPSGFPASAVGTMLFRHLQLQHVFSSPIPPSFQAPLLPPWQWVCPSSSGPRLSFLLEPPVG